MYNYADPKERLDAIYEALKNPTAPQVEVAPPIETAPLVGELTGAEVAAHANAEPGAKTGDRRAELMKYIEGRRKADDSEYEGRASELLTQGRDANFLNTLTKIGGGIAGAAQRLVGNEAQAKAMEGGENSPVFGADLPERRAQLEKWIAAKRAGVSNEAGLMQHGIDAEQKDQLQRDILGVKREQNVAENALREDDNQRKRDWAELQQLLAQQRLDMGNKLIAMRIKELQSRLDNTKANARKPNASQQRFDEKVAREARKEDKEARRLLVPGYEVGTEATDVLPTIQEAEKARKSYAALDSVKSTLRKLIDAYRQYGTENVPGPIQTQMRALATDAKLTMKGESQYGLGVLAGPDMTILEAAIPDPTSKDFLSLFNAKALDAAYETTLSQAQGRFDAQMASMGYRTAKPKQNAPASNGKVTLRDGDYEITVEADKVDEIRKKFPDLKPVTQ